VTPELSRTERRVWSHGTRGDTRALPYRAAGPVARADTRALPHREAGLESRGHTVTPEPFPAGCGVWHCGTRLKSYARGYPICRVPIVAPRPTSREVVNPQVGAIPFPLRGFDNICT
jgi:hypothetical protein